MRDLSSRDASETTGEAPVAATERILQGAALCFGRRGYHGTSMNELALQAGVSKSLLHYHFDTKAQIFLEVQLRVVRSLVERIHGLVAHRSGGEGPIHEALAEVYRFLETEIDRIAVVLELRTVAATRPDFRAHLDRFREEILRIVEAGIREVLGPAVDQLVLPPARLARVLSTIFHGLLVDLAFANDDGERALIRQSFSDFEVLVMRALFGAAS